MILWETFFYYFIEFLKLKKKYAKIYLIYTSKLTFNIIYQIFLYYEIDEIYDFCFNASWFLIK